MPSSIPIFRQLSPMIPAGKDLQAARDFYEQILGFVTDYSDDSMVILQRSAVGIILLNSDDPHTASQTSFRIELSDVEALYNEYKAHSIAPFGQGVGAGMTALKATPWRTREFAVRDLAGVCITFYEKLRP